MKRPAITDKMKLASAVYWGTLLCALCNRIFIFDETIEWDHAHPLALGGADDCTNIRPVCKDCHKAKTFGTKATTAGSDIHAIAKVKRLQRGKKPSRRPMKSAPKAWPKRKMGS